MMELNMESNDSSIIILSLCFVLIFCFAWLYPGCPLLAAIAIYVCCLTRRRAVAYCLCTLSSCLLTCWCCGGFKGEYVNRSARWQLSDHCGLIHNRVKQGKYNLEVNCDCFIQELHTISSTLNIMLQFKHPRREHVML